jgi:hypothetical protein
MNGCLVHRYLLACLQESSLDRLAKTFGETNDEEGAGGRGTGSLSGFGGFGGGRAGGGGGALDEMDRMLGMGTSMGLGAVPNCDYQLVHMQQIALVLSKQCSVFCHNTHRVHYHSAHETRHVCS